MLCCQTCLQVWRIQLTEGKRVNERGWRDSGEANAGRLNPLKWHKPSGVRCWLSPSRRAVQNATGPDNGIAERRWSASDTSPSSPPLLPLWRSVNHQFHLQKRWNVHLPHLRLAIYVTITGFFFLWKLSSKDTKGLSHVFFFLTGSLKSISSYFLCKSLFPVWASWLHSSSCCELLFNAFCLPSEILPDKQSSANTSSENIILVSSITVIT